jgi:hypothetical protein
MSKVWASQDNMENKADHGFNKDIAKSVIKDGYFFVITEIKNIRVGVRFYSLASS